MTCLLLNLPAPQIRELAPGPRGIARGCPDNELDNLHGLRLFTLPLYPGCTEQSVLRPGRHHISCASLGSTALVPPFQGLLVDHPVLLPSSRHPLTDPASPPKDTSNVSPITLSRVSHHRGQYQAMGLSNDVTEILLAVAHPSTRKTYKSAWGRSSR